MKNSCNTTLYNWDNIYQFPDFSCIKETDFAPCFYHVLEQADAEMEKIASGCESSVDDFLTAYELSGQNLSRVCAIFWLYVGTKTSPIIQKYETEFVSALSRFSSKWLQDERLFTKITKLYEEAHKDNFPLQTKRAIERHYKNFVYHGAALSETAKKRLSTLDEEQALLNARFSQNVLQEEAQWIHFFTEEEVKDLPVDLQHSMQALAIEHNKKEQATALKGYAINLSRSLVEAFLTFSSHRNLRKKVFKAWVNRGDNENTYNNVKIIKDILNLRQEKAELLGYKDFTSLKLKDTMAKSPEKVLELLNPFWEKAIEKAQKEEKDLQDLAYEMGLNEKIEAYDWRYYAEKLRAKRYNFDESLLKPYLQLENILQAAFATAYKLFGLRFEEKKEISLWDEDARFFLVKKENGEKLGYFIADYYARPSKRSGAWMSAIQLQHKLRAGSFPIVYNICNFTKPGKGERALLSLQDARTLFHEFGHALHGLLSDVIWPSLSGTSVARDFVELPSQLYEHWLMTNEILEKYICHEKTAQPVGKDFIEKLMQAKDFNAGFEAVEFTASALMDMFLHAHKGELDLASFERSTLERMKMPKTIVMRHRPTHFTHIFSSDGYAAGYYSYLWSEVLDADAFAFFEENGDVFDKKMAEKLKLYIYSAGGSDDPENLYQKFRGQAPNPSALIKKRNL